MTLAFLSFNLATRILKTKSIKYVKPIVYLISSNSISSHHLSIFTNTTSSTNKMDLSIDGGMKRFCGDNHHSRQESAIKIGTHNGVFHCDDVLACFMLKTLPIYHNAKIIRTRDEEKLKECDIVVDVGGVYDHSNLRYDHHQRSFTHTLNSLIPGKKWDIKLSSAGLIYVHYGHEIIANLLHTNEDDEITKAVYDKVYENFISEIDAIDNGVSICCGEQKYHINTHLSARVGNLSPKWNEQCTEEILLERFHKAIKLVEEEFMDKVNYYAKSWWPAKELVKESILSRLEVDQSGDIIELPQNGVPWKEHLFALEEEMKVGPFKYVIFMDSNGAWRVQAVPTEPSSFALRVPLLEEWQGLRDEELSLKSKIADCIFVHANGFIGGNKTRNGAIEMAKKSLKLSFVQNNDVESSMP